MSTKRFGHRKLDKSFQLSSKIVMSMIRMLRLSLEEHEPLLQENSVLVIYQKKYRDFVTSFAIMVESLALV